MKQESGYKKESVRDLANEKCNCQNKNSIYGLENKKNEHS